MGHFISKAVLYAVLFFASPAIEAMRTLDRRDPIVIMFSGGAPKHRARVLERRYGYLNGIRFIEFAP